MLEYVGREVMAGVTHLGLHGIVEWRRHRHGTLRVSGTDFSVEVRLSEVRRGQVKKKGS